MDDEITCETCDFIFNDQNYSPCKDCYTPKDSKSRPNWKKLSLHKKKVIDRIDYLNYANLEEGNKHISKTVLEEFWKLYNLLSEKIIPGNITVTPDGRLHMRLEGDQTSVLISFKNKN